MNILHKNLIINTYKIRSRDSNSTSSFTFKPQIHHRTNRNSSYYPKWNVFKFPQMQSKSQGHINSTYNQWFTYSLQIFPHFFSNFFFGTAVEESFCRIHPKKMKNTSVKMFQNLRFVSESGCKGKDFFINSKLFKRNFWSFFQTPTRAIFWRTLRNPKLWKPTLHHHSPALLV